MNTVRPRKSAIKILTTSTLDEPLDRDSPIHANH